MKPLSLDLASLASAYGASTYTPRDVVNEIHERIALRGKDPVWIHLVPRADALAQAASQEQRRQAGEALPLFGVPFAVKDNIDVAGLPTTAACPAFSYVAEKSATVVEELFAAGAILIGKTNLDQFAAGLVGVRTPYGICSSVFDSRYISGGSSAGSSVAVAAGLVSFSLGTDTAGSGRVPAAFNNIVGWKPTRGLVSSSGVVPACRSLDCVSFFSLTCGDALAIAQVVGKLDNTDPYSRAAPPPLPALPKAFRFGVPKPEQREFFGNLDNEALFGEAIARLRELGGIAVEIDFSPFHETAGLLYSGPWIAERLAAIEPFFNAHPETLHPVTAKIIGGGSKYSAVDAFRSFYRLEELKKKTLEEWTKMDVLVVPTAGTTYTIAAVEADPVQLNTNLGHYTNFVNLLDLSGVAVPSGFGPQGLPFGITFLGAAFEDEQLLILADRYHKALGGKLGATAALISDMPAAIAPTNPDLVSLAVVGAHLTGQPLNSQLTERGATLLQTTTTASGYRLYALKGTVPAKPGLVRAPGFAGPGIQVEVWQIGRQALGDFMTKVPAPLGIGSIELTDGSVVKGFVCEPFAVSDALDITRFAGWRGYIGSLSADS